MQSKLTSCFIIFILCLSHSPLASALDQHSINQQVARSFPDFLELRRDLHAHPEASGAESRTSSIVSKRLAKLGFDVRANVGGFGVVGLLRGARPGHTIAWRADMDASYFVANNDAKHAGQNQELAHVCGHDVHTTIALGIAEVFARHREALSGNLMLLFQPAEETQKGALAMLDDGVFSDTRPSEIYGLHIGPAETGVVSTMSGNVFAHTRRLVLEFEPSDADSRLYDDLEIITDSLSHGNMARVKNPSLIASSVFGLHNPDTDFANFVFFSPQFRSTKPDQPTRFEAEVYSSSMEALDDVAASLATKLDQAGYTGEYKLRSFAERKGVNNDPELVDAALEILDQGAKAAATERLFGRVPFSSEDFGHFQEKVPGVYFFLGASNPSKGIFSMPHTPGFAVDEDVIRIGVQRFSFLLNERMKNKTK